MIIFEFIFWISLFAIFYAYFGYISILWLLSLVKYNPVKRDDINPHVSIVISAYNEEKVISSKIENTLELDYPKDLLSIAIISDGSTDRTNEFIKMYADREKRIIPYIMPSNVGKTMGLNRCVPMLPGDIVIFTDANSFFPKDLITKIVRPFSDERIGFVTGATEYFTKDKANVIKVKNMYSKLEYLTKKLESGINSCVGADGAIFAIRKKLFSVLQQEDINDFVIPMMIIKQGYRGIMESDVITEEETSSSNKSEFNRQVRITNRTLHALFTHKALFNPFVNGFFSFELFSHKVMKFIVPFLMILMFLTNALIIYQHYVYFILLTIQVLLYAFTSIIHIYRNKRHISGASSMIHSFVFFNMALLKGWITFFQGQRYINWSPER